MKNNSLIESLSKGWWLFAAILVCAIFWTVRSVAADSTEKRGENRLVTIHDRGLEQTVVTNATTVRGALHEAGIEVSKSDVTEPTINSQLSGGQYNVNVYRARPVVVSDGVSQVRVLTAAQSPIGIAKAANVTLYDEDKTTMERVDDVLADGGAGLKLSIDRATPFTFVLYGKPIIARTHQTTVGEMLKEKGVKLGPNDGVSVADDTPIVAGMSISVWRNGVQTVTVEEDIAMPIRQIYDVNQPVGYKLVQTPGKVGKKQVTYEINTQNGREVSRKEIQSVATAQPAEQVEVIGAKSSSPAENEAIAWDFLMAQGFSRNQTAGIMGNLMQEHGFRTDGDGLAQWTGGRLANLLSRPNPRSIHTQLEFLMFELNGSYSKVKAGILASSSVEQSVVIFQNQYERCGICAESKRIQYAYEILGRH